jgi:protein involved in polysaccharide export with SLBB domain
MKIIKTIILLLFISHTGFSQSGDNNSGFASGMAALNIISVTIGGDFIVNGTFPASQTERVDQLITRIYNEAKIANLTAVKDGGTFTRLKIQLESFAKRDILLKRFNGEEIKLDLERFRLTGDFSLNPYLKNGDVLIFPVLDLDKNFIEITGAVNKEIQLNENEIVPLKIQYVKGDKLSDALLFAQGINPAYENVTKAAISRLSYDGITEDVIEVDIADDFELKIGDRITIIADETQKRNFRVKVEGEVNKPGYIYITKDNTSIREVIKKAGGFKKNAGLNRAELIRGSNVYNSPLFTQEFETLMMQRMSDIQLEDSVSFIIDNKLRYSRGNLTLDFEKIFDENFDDGDFIVKDNDYIFVPEKIYLIYVYGQVANPGYLEYVEGEGVFYYLEKAGGIGKTAKDEIYLIEGTTRTWIEVEEDEAYNISPGDYIWIPKDPPRDFDYYLNRIGNIAGIVGGIATVILLLVQVGK